MKKNMVENRKKPIAVAVIVIVCIIGGLYYFFGSTSGRLIGEVEAVIIPSKAEVYGKILEMPIEIGAPVKKGAVIALIESTDIEYEIEQLEISLEKKRLALAESQISSDKNTQAKNNIEAARAAYNNAEALHKKANKDYEKELSLYKEGAISTESLENTKLKLDSATNALSAAWAQLQNASSSSLSESIELDIKQIESQLNQKSEKLKKYSIEAPADGIIVSKSYVVGDMVSPGFDLADIADSSERYLVFYLPKKRLNSIDYDQSITIVAKGKEYKGLVKYIDVSEQYTPKDFQTMANKNKESFKIKLLLPVNFPLKPGETAEVYI